MSPKRKLLNSSIRTRSFADDGSFAGAHTKNPCVAPRCDSPESKANGYTGDWKKMKRRVCFSPSGENMEGDQQGSGSGEQHGRSEMDLCLRGVALDAADRPESARSFLGSRKCRAFAEPTRKIREPYSFYQADGDVVVSPRQSRTFKSNGFTPGQEEPQSPVSRKKFERERTQDLLVQTSVTTNQHVVSCGKSPGEVLIGKGTPANSVPTSSHYASLMRHHGNPSSCEARNMAKLFRARDQSSMNFQSTYEDF